tara:strand:+ start:936 stop:1829 length:894 start_codon:yes stop_codon:yes gene_type:complete
MNQDISEPSEINLRFIFNIVSKKAKRILIYSFFVFLITLLILQFIPDKYSSTATLSPNKENQSLDQSALQGLGAISSFVGFGQGSENVSSFQIALEKIKSRDFIENFINREETKLKLLGGLKWNPLERKFVYDPSIYDVKTKVWLIEVPSDYKIFKEFKKNLRITKKGTSGLIEIKFTSTSPILSQKIIEQMITLINEVMSSEALNKAIINLDFLNREINNQQNIQTKNAIYRLMESQLQKKMLASNKFNYIFEVVNPPMVPEEKSSPWRLGIIFSSIIIFNFFYIFFLVILNLYRK